MYSKTVWTFLIIKTLKLSIATFSSNFVSFIAFCDYYRPRGAYIEENLVERVLISEVGLLIAGTKLPLTSFFFRPSAIPRMANHLS